MTTEIHWKPGKDGTLLGYTEMDRENPDEPAERENPPLVIKRMTYPPGFTLYRNDFKLGNFLFLKDIGRHDTLDQAKEVRGGDDHRAERAGFPRVEQRSRIN